MVVEAEVSDVAPEAVGAITVERLRLIHRPSPKTSRKISMRLRTVALGPSSVSAKRIKIGAKEIESKPTESPKKAGALESFGRYLVEAREVMGKSGWEAGPKARVVLNCSEFKHNYRVSHHRVKGT